MDLAEFSTLYPYPQTVQFIGYKADGSSVTAEFTTDGVIDGTGPLADFQTFYFGSQFADLVRFEVPTYGYAMDNLVFFDVVPEPGAGQLLILGGAVAAVLSFLQTKTQQFRRRPKPVSKIARRGFQRSSSFSQATGQIRPSA